MAADGEAASGREFAPAKINLSLHVTGRRADGYHLLDSLVVFAGVGDWLTLEPGAGLTISGPFAAGLNSDSDNLVQRAIAIMGGGAAAHLEKNLPVAAGIGGGTSDAAAVLRAMARLTGRAIPAPAALAPLGADLPVCLRARPCRMQGTGERLTDLPALPPAWLVLANPRIAVPTGSVFSAMESRDNSPMVEIPRFADAADLAAFLRTCRNDMQHAATTICPAIALVLAALSDTRDCLLVRMSGSGATCFGLYASRADAEAAAAALAGRGWWVAAAPMLAGLSQPAGLL
ncbi:4-(cytidine 5'-diphospho)-2-C-methyl-D-erythritol kinase [Paracoccus pacificus]|uniref:4-diphosphocytidyl-2-C-methyl-D-erythritol kinase n=1 Tax=Paracoccus pacificus TaxID=1463598 RepID=A0ABW4RBT2_9RHOB